MAFIVVVCIERTTTINAVESFIVVVSIEPNNNNNNITFMAILVNVVESFLLFRVVLKPNSFKLF